jgi:hypothetical protein
MYLKGFLGIKEELEEGEDEESHSKNELTEIQKQAKLHGIPVPKR